MTDSTPPISSLLLDAPHMVDTGACCAACFKTEDSLLRCSACLHSWYCNQDCQRAHFKAHKPFCKVLKQFHRLNADLPADIRPKTGKEFYVQRLNARRLLEQLMRKPLGQAEGRAIMNEAKCSVCMLTRDQVGQGQLQCCPRCHWGWVCEQHAHGYLTQQHQRVCGTYKLMNECQMWLRTMITQTGKVPSYRPDALRASYEPLPATGWKAYAQWRGLPSFDPAVFATFSKRLSQPVTVLLALQALYSEQEVQAMTSLVVHVVGAGSFEVPADGVWEELLHVLPGLTSLHVDFIGPEVAEIILEEEDGVVLPKPTCQGCEKLGRKRSYAYHMCTYHDLLSKQERMGKEGKPTIAVAFNSGMHEEDSWLPTVRAMISACIPVAFTCYAKEEAEDDSSAWVKAGGCIVHPVSENAYRALEPLLEPGAVDTFFYQNYYWFCGRGAADPS